MPLLTAQEIEGQLAALLPAAGSTLMPLPSTSDTTRLVKRLVPDATEADVAAASSAVSGSVTGVIALVTASGVGAVVGAILGIVALVVSTVSRIPRADGRWRATDESHFWWQQECQRLAVALRAAADKRRSAVSWSAPPSPEVVVLTSRIMEASMVLAGVYGARSPGRTGWVNPWSGRSPATLGYVPPTLAAMGADALACGWGLDQLNTGEGGASAIVEWEDWKKAVFAARGVVLVWTEALEKAGVQMGERVYDSAQWEPVSRTCGAMVAREIVAAMSRTNLVGMLQTSSFDVTRGLEYALGQSVYTFLEPLSWAFPPGRKTSAYWAVFGDRSTSAQRGVIEAVVVRDRAGNVVSSKTVGVIAGQPPQSQVVEVTCDVGGLTAWVTLEMRLAGTAKPQVAIDCGGQSGKFEPGGGVSLQYLGFAVNGRFAYAPESAGRSGADGGGYQLGSLARFLRESPPIMIEPGRYIYFYNGSKADRDRARAWAMQALPGLRNASLVDPATHAGGGPAIAAQPRSLPTTTTSGGTALLGAAVGFVAGGVPGAVVGYMVGAAAQR